MTNGLVGFIIGFLIALFLVGKLNTKFVKRGFVTIDDELYKLEKIDVSKQKQLLEEIEG